MIKTTHAALPALERFIRDHHPYDTPEFVVVGADYVEPRYAAWIAQAVK
jgi:periplasmic divalent cation tolerance protein